MEGYKLHPLVLINVSDHYTRMKAQLAPAEEPDRVMGCLLRIQTGNREVEICTSFEVKYETVDGIPTFDAEYLGQQQGRYKQVFPKFDVVDGTPPAPPWTPTSTSRSTAPWRT